MSGQAATSRWARLWAWLYGRRAAYPAAVPVRAPPLQAATTAAPADDGLPTAQVHAQLQFGLHALALAPRLASEPEPAGSAELEREVAQALQAQDWASRYLPRRPQLLPQLIQTVNDDAGSARVMATIIGQDPVLTGNLLRIANSPAFKVNERPVESLQRAVTLVGTEGVRQIISAVLVQPVMQVDCPQFPQFSAIVWEHALLASRAAADHARAVSGGDAFAAQWLGLTQGLGTALVMRQLCQLARPRGQDLAPAMVLRLLQQWSLPVAQRVAAAWELPGPVQPVLHAHARGALADSLQFGCAAAAASLLCRHGRATQGQMLAVLEQLPGVPLHALHWSWRRLHGRSVETLAEHDAPAGAAALP